MYTTHLPSTKDYVYAAISILSVVLILLYGVYLLGYHRGYNAGGKYVMQQVDEILDRYSGIK